MRTTDIVLLGLLFLLLAWAGAGGIAYGVVELSGRGDTGGEGPPGIPGQQGPPGPPGSSGSDVAQAMVKRLASLWAVQTVSGVTGGQFVTFTDAQVVACVDYILSGEGGFESCPGFQH